MTQTKNFTRQDYLNHNCSHSEYYGQYVNGQIKSLVLYIANKEQLKDAFLIDENLNNIPLSKWDKLVPMVTISKQQMKDNGDYYTKGGGVCILKEAARQIINS